MSLAWIREYYGVPAKRGMRIVFDGRLATIVGAGLWDGRIRIRLDGENHAVSAHPTWRIEYPGGDMSRTSREHAIWMADNAEDQVEQVARFLHANESLHMHENVGDATPCNYCYLRAGKAIYALLGMAAGVTITAHSRVQCSACKRYFSKNADGSVRKHRGADRMGCTGSNRPPQVPGPDSALGAKSILEGRP
jgi:hypothetical protein